MCFAVTPVGIFVRVGVMSAGSTLCVDVCELMWRTAVSDKGMLSLFMPPLRHFHQDVLDISITLFFFFFFFTVDLTSYIMFRFSSQRTAQQAKERSQTKKSAAASKVASDITRFFIKKWNGKAGLDKTLWEVSNNAVIFPPEHTLRSHREIKIKDWLSFEFKSLEDQHLLTFWWNPL